MNKIDLNGKRAAVTGGAQGIGRAITERLLESGATVALWDMDTELMNKTVAELGSNAHGVTVDVTDPDSVAKGLEQTNAEIGGLDILVTMPAFPGRMYRPGNTRLKIGVGLSTLI